MHDSYQRIKLKYTAPLGTPEQLPKHHRHITNQLIKANSCVLGENGFNNGYKSQ